MIDLDDNYILTEQLVKGYRYGNHLELGTNIGNRNPVKKHSKIEYIDDEGNIREFANVSENRSESLASLKKTMDRLRRLIKNNFYGHQNELWITLTYAENVTDSKRVYRDYKAFMKKLRRHYGHVEYISVLEPQKRGAWHIHALFKSEEHEKFYIPNSHLSKLWGHGFVKVKKMNESDNVAAYVTAYLTDLKVNDKSESDGIKKGARLHLYPSGMNFYRMSRGIKKPETFTATKEYVFKFFNVSNSVYAPDRFYTYDVELPDGMTLTYKREFYDLKGWL